MDDASSQSLDDSQGGHAAGIVHELVVRKRVRDLADEANEASTTTTSGASADPHALMQELIAPRKLPRTFVGPADVDAASRWRAEVAIRAAEAQARAVEEQQASIPSQSQHLVFYNQSVVLAKRPENSKKASASNFAVVLVDMPKLPPNGVIVQTKGLGLDPSMRSQLHPATSLSGAAPFTIGNVCSGPGYGVVLASNNPHFLKHDWVSSASWPWQTVAAFRSTSSLAPVDPMNGVALAEIPLLTAYLAVKQLGTLEPGSTVAVTDAHGPLATLICQFARLLLRARIIVLTNSDAKCRVFREDSDVAGVVNCAYYLDSTTGSNAHPVSQNSASASSSPDALGALTTAVHLHCPSEIHALIDTVGGPVLLAAARLIKAGGKIVTCEQPHGLLDDRARSCSNSLVNSSKPPPLPLLVLKRLSARRITRHHLLLANHVAELPTLLQTIQQLVATDQLHLRKTIFDGIDSIPAAFETMLDTRPSSCGILQVRI